MRARRRSDDLQLAKGTPFRDSLVAEGRTVERAIAAVDDPLRQSLSNGRGLLETVTGKAVCEEEILHVRMRPDHRVLVESVVVVVPGPGPAWPYRLEGGDAGCERRPDHLLKQAPVGLEIVRVRSLFPKLVF